MRGREGLDTFFTAEREDQHRERNANCPFIGSQGDHKKMRERRLHEARGTRASRGGSPRATTSITTGPVPPSGRYTKTKESHAGRGIRIVRKSLHTIPKLQAKSYPLLDHQTHAHTLARTPVSLPPSRESPPAVPGTLPRPSRSLPGPPPRSRRGEASPAFPRRSRTPPLVRPVPGRGGRRRRRCGLSTHERVWCGVLQTYVGVVYTRKDN